MENYNGQSQFEQQQNQYTQNQYDQTQYNNSIQNMYQVTGYQHVYDSNVNYTKPKKKIWKWLLISGLSSIVLITTIILIIVLSSPSYEVNNFNKVSAVCSNVLNTKLKDQTSYYSNLLNSGILAIARGNGRYSKVESGITWTRFLTEENAESYYKGLVNEYKEDYLDEVRGSAIGNWESDSKKTEISLVYAKESAKIIFIREEECVLFLQMEGNSDTVERLAEKFLEGLE